MHPARRQIFTVTAAGVDETSSKPGHNDLSTFAGLRSSRVLFATDGMKSLVQVANARDHGYLTLDNLMRLSYFIGCKVNFRLKG